MTHCIMRRLALWMVSIPDQRRDRQMGSKRLPDIHPGDLLMAEFLEPLGLQAEYDLEEARQSLGQPLSQGRVVA